VVLIRTEEVWKTYGVDTARQVDAVRNVSVTIDKGTITAFAGPSGSGKTTLLSLIGLLSRPSRGRVFLDEQEVSQYSEVYRTKMRRDEIGFIFQAQYLIPQLTAVENVALPKICTDISRDEAEEQAKVKLIEIGLEQRLEIKEIQKLSNATKSEVLRISMMIKKSQHKRRLPLIPKIGLRTPGIDWRIPTQEG